jgi:hypothetical protein
LANKVNKYEKCAMGFYYAHGLTNYNIFCCLANSEFMQHSTYEIYSIGETVKKVKKMITTCMLVALDDISQA